MVVMAAPSPYLSQRAACDPQDQKQQSGVSVMLHA